MVLLRRIFLLEMMQIFSKEKEKIKMKCFVIFRISGSCLGYQVCLRVLFQELFIFSEKILGSRIKIVGKFMSLILTIYLTVAKNLA